MAKRPELLELFGVPDVFVTGLGKVENIGGGCYRFTFFVSQDNEMVVAAKIVMSADALPDAISMATRLTEGALVRN